MTSYFFLETCQMPCGREEEAFILAMQSVLGPPLPRWRVLHLWVGWGWRRQLGRNGEGMVLLTAAHAVGHSS